MMHSNRFSSLLYRVVVLGALLVSSLSACTVVDDSLGANLIPENQQMKAGYLCFELKERAEKYIETRLYQTDSITASNVSAGYLGMQLNDTLGLRKAGFLSQMTNYYLVDEGYFGFKPIFDSAQLNLSITSYGRDTTTEIEFGVYEILSNDYLTKKPLGAGKLERDTNFILGFDPLNPNSDGSAEPVYDPSKRLFTFTLGGKHGPSTTAVTLKSTPEGRKYIDRLMLQEGKYKGDYSVYDAKNVELFVEEFKGLYIRPEGDITEYGKGNVYATTLSGTTFSVFGRTRVEEDPSLIKDTIGMVYYLYDEVMKAGKVSVNVIDHDYTRRNPNLDPSAMVTPEEVDAEREERPEKSQIFVEGLGGVVTEITFTEEFFNRFETILAEEEAATHNTFSTFAIVQARMEVFFKDSRYDWGQIDPTSQRLLDEMNTAPARLGLYTNYKKLEGVSDYDYYSEQAYQLTIPYGGYINRSRGCYIMDISGHIQTLWNNYLSEKKAAEEENRAIDLNKVEGRKIYLAPEAYDLFTTSFGTFQGAPMLDDEGEPLNAAPIRFSITYNMIK